MAHVTKTAIIRRNTATLALGAITQPACGLMADDVAAGNYLFSFDPADPANERLIFAIDDTSTYEAEQFLAKPFNLVNWAVKKIMMPDQETGEMRPQCRTTLIDDKSETLSFVSIGVLLSLDLIRTLRGDGPYDPPIPTIVKSVKTNRGFRLYKIQPYYGDDNKSK